jgi:hypothetical protein
MKKATSLYKFVFSGGPLVSSGLSFFFSENVSESWMGPLTQFGSATEIIQTTTKSPTTDLQHPFQKLIQTGHDLLA